MEDQRSVILHLISQLKLGVDLTKVGGRAPRDLWPVTLGAGFPSRLPLSSVDASGTVGKAFFLFGCASHSMWDLTLIGIEPGANHWITRKVPGKAISCGGHPCQG